MKREIKFRAWIKTGIETYDYVKPMTIQQMIHSKKSTFSLKQLNDLVYFEQFTGLKDVNSKDIYENDIVQVNYSGNDNFSGIALVVFRNGYFELEGKIMKIINSEGLMYDDFYAISNDLSHYSACVKVIGNKFENPELLGVEE